MMKTVVLMALIVALPLAALGGESYRLTLWQTSVIAGAELKAGDYKLDVLDGKIVLSNGKSSVESAAKLETVDTPYRSSSVRYDNGTGRPQVIEIRIGKTAKKLVLPGGGKAMGGSR